MKEITNQDLFVDPAELIKQVEAEKSSAVEKDNLLAKVDNQELGTVDDGATVEVKFCTGGRLSAPPILHFRDYTLQASQVMAEYQGQIDSDEDDVSYYPMFERVLNAMVVEDFDCGQLHIEEAKEVLLNVYGKWWGRSLNNFRYLINPDIEDEAKLTAAENISIADIPLSSLNVIPLASEIKEPINITVHGITVRFVYPRIRNIGIADKVLKIKFAVEEQKFFKIKELIKFNKKHEDDPENKILVDLAEAQAYEDYVLERERWRIIYNNAQLICGIDNEVLSTFEDRVKALVEDKRLLAKHWEIYWKFIEGKGKFGVENKAEFFSDVLNQKVTRPFLIRAFNFMPWDSMVSDGDESSKICFG